MLALVCTPALANNVGENEAWQFQTSTDEANQALIQDMIQRHKHGFYSAPIYNTTIAQQNNYNCNVAATSQGNQGSNSTTANTQSTAGNNAGAVGNQNQTGVGGYGYGTGSTDSTQANSGQVSSSASGSPSNSLTGSADQALNSTQTNSGDQYSKVTGSTACSFGPLN